MHANSALVKHALAKAHLLFANEAAGANQGRDLEDQVGDYPYSDDSDLEDEDMQDSAFNQQDGCTDERDTHRKSDGEHGRPSPGVIKKESTTTPTDDFVSVSTSDEVDQYASDLEESNGRLSATSPDTFCMRAQPAASTEPAVQRFGMVPTVVLNDTAYQTWRTFVFYAYTHRISFAPLRSQGLDPVPSGVAHGLPICSPKSMYRLAVTYGNAELQQLARSDIASKLSTKNALTELFSGFTARYPEIQDMVLDFVLAHLQHPNITSCLAYWVGRFARGELEGCAGTFERFIQRLASAATAAASQGGGMGSKS